MTKHRFDPVRIGVIGLGSFGRLHALTAVGLAETELVALVGRSQGSRDRMHSELPDTPIWSIDDLQQAIDKSAAEAWIVASATASHIPITEQILAAGKVALVEKPLAIKLDEAKKLAPRVKPDSSNIMLGHILLFNSELRQLQDEIKARSPIVYINCVRHRPTALVEMFPDETPLDLTMVHDLYVVQALTHRREPTHISARVHHTPTRRMNLAVAQLQWDDGAIASFTASFLTPQGMGGDGFDRMEVFGDQWAARINANPRPIEIWDDRARYPMTLEIRADPTAPSGMLAEQMRCFARVVRGLEPVPVGATYHDAMQVQGWLEKLEHAAAHPHC